MKKLLLIATLIGTLSASWSTLLPIDAYGKGEFNLKRGVKYIEIHYHGVFRIYSYQNRKNHLDFCFYKIGKKPLESFGKSAERTFKKYRKVGNRAKALVERDASSEKELNLLFYNAYMIDSKGKFWLLESKQDLIDMVKPIDTPSEAALILWLNGYDKIDSIQNRENYFIGYKKLKSGYKILQKYKVMDKDYIGCTEYKYIYNISSRGRQSKKLISKKVKVQCVD